MFSALPTNDLTVAANNEYTFTFTISLLTTQGSLQDQLIADLAPYATNISVKTSGLSTATVNLTPINSMPLSAWQSIFSEEPGIGEMTDMYVGGTISSQPVDVIGAYTPYVKAAEQGIKNIGTSIASPLTSITTWIEYVAIAAAVVVGGILIMKYMPASKSK